VDEEREASHEFRVSFCVGFCFVGGYGAGGWRGEGSCFVGRRDYDVGE
jgi:hypothetical protein